MINRKLGFSGFCSSFSAQLCKHKRHSVKRENNGSAFIKNDGLNKITNLGNKKYI
tara:strand:+ start:1096 stop:1260 length:165 start_codon:yes stop_codon:yes gene_type:complete